jgi:mono/diheme cytochrome c family protein
MRMRWAVRFSAVLGVGLSAWLLYPYLRARVLALEETPAVRGYRVAARLGCFGCHGPAGLGGVANPGSEEGEVPAFVEQTQMMYVTSPEELREYVLDGAPARQLADPEYRERVERAALRMPAYRDIVSAADLEDLVAYLRATSGQLLPRDALAARGAALAMELDCFACHGPLGAGGVSNPGSFKGYVPGFWGADYDELVRDDEELRAWIADGRIDRIAEHPIGGRFFRGQAIKMPAYGSFVSAEDVDALAAFVRWIRAGTWHAELG